MADYRRYQPRYSGGGSGRWRRVVIFTAIMVVAILVGKSILDGKQPNNNENTNESEITLVNEGGNANVDANNTNGSETNANENANQNANTNGNSNTNTTSSVAGSETFSDDFSLDICKTPISSFGKAKFVALTFDLSAANEDAQKVLDVLKDKKARASFFSRGTFAEKNKEFVAAVGKAGFGVYSGSYETKNLSALSNEEVTAQITKAETAIEAATSETPKPLMRPPSGDYDADVIATAREAGYCLVLWTVDAFDWQDGITAAESTQRVMDKAAPGAIVALHAGYDVTPVILPGLIDQLRAAGYTLVSLPTLFQQ